MTNLIPMAGEGSRFKTEGFRLPKPLIPVSGVPMVLQASNCLPPAANWIYLCRSEHLQAYDLKRVLTESRPGVQVVEVPGLTEGQACTCLLARDSINNDAELFIAASDNGMLWDRTEFERLKQAYDALIWTFRGHPAVLEKPQAYGWVVTEGSTANRVSVKVPISDHPMDDHAVVGAFWFRRGSIFVEAADRMIAENRRVNNEFYVDEALNDALALGYRVGVLPVEDYLCWGTPDDLRTFEYWQEFFSRSPRHSYQKPETPLAP